jgi:hypothetical protein
MKLIMRSKVLAFAFWELRGILRAISDDKSVDWRAMGILICTQIAVIMSVFAIASVMLGRRIIPGSGPTLTLFGVLLSATVTAINYYAVWYEKRWKSFEREFESYSVLVRRFGGVVVIALPIMTIAGIAWLVGIVAQLPE